MKTTDYEELPPIDCEPAGRFVVYALAFCSGALFSLFVMAVL